MRRLMLVLSVVALLLAFSTVLVTAQSNEIAHVVQPGENLFRISLRYNVSMNAIATRNSISNISLIFAGTTLYIPTTSGGDTGDGGDGGDSGDGGTPTTVEYIVKAGDTLGKIASQFGTTWQAIATNNNLANPNLIFPGQKLLISGTPSSGGDGSSGGDTGNNPPPINSTSFELGGHVFSFSSPSQMTGAGMTWAKSQIRWSMGQGPEIAQGAIDAAHGNGFKVLLSVIGNPNQLAANPTQYYQEFATFLGGVAALGADGIEVWNEMNIDREWPRGLISGVQYTSMLSNAYQAIKANNANTLVISGAPAPTGFFQGCTGDGCDDDKYIAQMAQAGAANYMDCVGIHFNSGTTSPSATSGAPVSSFHYSWYYQPMVNLYANTFPGKPLCFTELGYLTGEGFGSLPGGFSWASGNTLAEQAQWLAETVQLAKSSSVVRLIIVWNVDGTTYGDDPQAGYAIIRPDGTCPACSALDQVMN